jgi:hypothetical protein
MRTVDTQGVYARTHSERTSEPNSVHGGVHAALLLVLKLQLPANCPSVITKHPEMLGRALGPVDLNLSARHALGQSASGTASIPCASHVVSAGT